MGGLLVLHPVVVQGERRGYLLARPCEPYPIFDVHLAPLHRIVQLHAYVVLAGVVVRFHYPAYRPNARLRVVAPVFTFVERGAAPALLLAVILGAPLVLPFDCVVAMGVARDFQRPIVPAGLQEGVLVPLDAHPVAGAVVALLEPPDVVPVAVVVVVDKALPPLVGVVALGLAVPEILLREVSYLLVLDQVPAPVVVVKRERGGDLLARAVEREYFPV